MLATYKATIQGDRIQWQDAEPRLALAEHPLEVLVTVLDVAGETDAKQRGKKMANALRQVAEGSCLNALEDPARWEREIRQDRALPGRDA